MYRHVQMGVGALSSYPSFTQNSGKHREAAAQSQNDLETLLTLPRAQRHRQYRWHDACCCVLDFMGDLISMQCVGVASMIVHKSIYEKICSGHTGTCLLNRQA